MTPTIYRILTLLLGLLTACVAVAGDITAERQAAADTVLAKMELVRVRGEAPGLGVAVARGGRVLWSGASGWADRESEEPAGTDTRFGLGSISKVLTASLCARLVDAGKLDWNAPVERYLPDFPFPGRGITVRRILGHLAGLDTEFDAEYRLTDEHFDSTQAVLDLYLQRPLRSEPGTEAAYATVSYTIVAAVIERVTGQLFREAMAEYLLEPLDMRATRPNDMTEEVAGRTRFYRRNDGLQVVEAPFFDPSYKWAGAGYLATAADIARLGSGVMQEGFLEPATLDEMWEPLVTDAGQETKYAAAWEVQAAGDRRMIYKTGGGPGISTLVVVYPEADLCVAVLSNLTGFDGCYPLVQEAARAFWRILPPPASVD